MKGGRRERKREWGKGEREREGRSLTVSQYNIGIRKEGVMCTG